MLNYSSFKLWVVGIISILILSCATADRHRYREGDNTGQDVELTPKDEKKLTEEVLPDMKKNYPPVKDKWLQNYVASVGKKLVIKNNLEGKPYHYNFTVVDVNYVNAFALPAGTIFVTAPLINMAESEAELAGVIGHEIGHVVARHTAERMYRAKKTQKKNIFTAAGAGVVGGVVGFGLGKVLCKKGDTKCLLKAAGAGAVVGAGGTLLVQRYKFMKNSQEDEMEADRIGFRVATRAGYSGAHVGRFYEKLLKMEKQHGQSSGVMKAVTDAMSTHPPSDKRVKQMNKMDKKYKAKSKPIISTQNFTKAKQHVAKIMKNAKKK